MMWLKLGLSATLAALGFEIFVQLKMWLDDDENDLLAVALTTLGALSGLAFVVSLKSVLDDEGDDMPFGAFLLQVCIVVSLTFIFLNVLN